MKEKINRSQFFKKGAAVTVGISALTFGSGLLFPSKAKAEVKAKATWPWPYPSGGLDPEVVRKTAHDDFWAGFACCGGVFKSLVDELVSAVGAPWTDMPPEIMRFGHGGGAEWGTLCGTLNGASAVIQLVCDYTNADALISELYGWYTITDLPTTISDGYATSDAYTHNDYDMSLVANTSGSPLCHVSVAEWCKAAAITVGANEQKERCARLAGDVAAKAVELLNAYFAGTFTAQYTDPALNTTCLACHGSAGSSSEPYAKGKMECSQCHGSDVYPHTSKIDVQDDSDAFIKQYPNPFNTQTSLEFTIDKPKKVTIEVINLNGQHIKTLVSNKSYSQGTYTVKWDGNNEYGQKVASGMYILKVQKGKSIKTITMMKS